MFSTVGSWVSTGVPAIEAGGHFSFRLFAYLKHLLEAYVLKIAAKFEEVLNGNNFHWGQCDIKSIPLNRRNDIDKNTIAYYEFIL